MPRARRVYKARRSIGTAVIVKDTAKLFIKEFKTQGKLTNRFLTSSGIHQWLYKDAQRQLAKEKGYEVEVSKYVAPEKELAKRTEKWFKVTKPSHDRMVKKLQANAKRAGNIGGQKALKDMGFGSIDFNLQDERLIDKLNARGTAITGVIAQNTRKRFNKLLIKSYYDLGEDPRTVAKVIDNLFEKTYKNRAWTIAKTETAIAQSEVQHETYVENGVKMRSWLALRDPKTRSSHTIFMTQQSPRKIDTPFRNPETGMTILYPHDPTAPAEELINCRCDETVESFYAGKKPSKEDVWSG